MPKNFSGVSIGDITIGMIRALAPRCKNMSELVKRLKQSETHTEVRTVIKKLAGKHRFDLKRCFREKDARPKPTDIGNKDRTKGWQFQNWMYPYLKTLPKYGAERIEDQVRMIESAMNVCVPQLQQAVQEQNGDIEYLLRIERIQAMIGLLERLQSGEFFAYIAQEDIPEWLKDI